jgi:hypothetical protein
MQRFVQYSCFEEIGSEDELYIKLNVACLLNNSLDGEQSFWT